VAKIKSQQWFHTAARDRYKTIWWLVHWPLVDGLLHLVQWRAASAGGHPIQSPPSFTLLLSVIRRNCARQLTIHSAKVIVPHRIIGIICYSEEGTGRAAAPPVQSPSHCIKCNSLPINSQCIVTVLLYNGPLLCSFNVAIKGLKKQRITCWWNTGEFSLLIKNGE